MFIPTIHVSSQYDIVAKIKSNKFCDWL